MTPGMRRQGDDLPALTYERIDEEPLEESGSVLALTMARVEIVCYALTYAQARDAADAVKATLSGFQGTLTAGFYCQAIFPRGKRDITDTPDRGSDFGVHEVALVFECWFEES